MSQSELERTFETRWKQLGGPELEREYRFHPTRRWSFDFAEPSRKIAFECEGATFKGGRHTRGEGYAKDCIKYNQAQILGWRVYRFTSDMLASDPEGHLQPIIELMRREPNYAQSERK